MPDQRTKEKKAYLKKYKKDKASGKKPQTYGQYVKGKRKATKRTSSVESQLRSAGLSYSEIARLRD